jgi:hypothetical protein
MTWSVLQTPNFLRHLDNQPELGSLVLHRQLIAEHGAGKAALWTDTELVERNVLASSSMRRFKHQRVPVGRSWW